MLYQIKVFPNSKFNQVVVCENDGESGGADLEVHLTAKAVDGAANAALITALANHFHCRKSQVFITAGLKSRHKTVQIML